jgi:hypothetical protein
MARVSDFDGCPNPRRQVGAGPCGEGQRWVAAGASCCPASSVVRGGLVPRRQVSIVPPEEVEQRVSVVALGGTMGDAGGRCPNSRRRAPWSAGGEGGRRRAPSSPRRRAVSVDRVRPASPRLVTAGRAREDGGRVLRLAIYGTVQRAVGCDLLPCEDVAAGGHPSRPGTLNKRKQDRSPMCC